MRYVATPCLWEIRKTYVRESNREEREKKWGEKIGKEEGKGREKEGKNNNGTKEQ